MYLPASRRPGLLALLPLVILAGPFGGRTGPPVRAHVLAGMQAPTDLDAFLARTRAVLDSGKADSALADPPPEALLWRGNPKRWHLNVLSLPGAKGPAQRVAVFSRFHAPQYEGDFVFRLVHSTEGWRYGAEVPETETSGYRIRDHRFTIRLDPQAGRANLVDTLTVERIGFGKTAAPCLLRLSCDMQVDRLRVEGTASIAFSAVPGLIAVALPADRRRFTLDMDYHRIQDTTGGDPLDKNGALLAAPWYPHIARLPARSESTIIVPNGWTAIGQGELIGRTATKAEMTFHYLNPIPTSYLFVAAGPYTAATRTMGGRRYTVYQNHPDLKQADEALAQIGAIMAFYEARFGPFPYRHYDLVETPGSGGAALEAYSFAMFSGGDFSALPHELAHTWWGGVVPNPYTRSLWNESLAEYSQIAFLRQTPEWKPFSMHPAPDYGRRYLRILTAPLAESPNLSKIAYSTGAYVKGLFVLLMLEDLIGKEALWKSLRAFRDGHRAGEAADWPDVQRAVRKVTGKDYTWFFDQWLRRAGVPEVRLSEVRQSLENGKYVVTAQIEQFGTPYRLRLPVVLKTSNGKTMSRTVETSGAKTAVRLTCDAPPARLDLDPEGIVLMAGRVEGAQDDPFGWKGRE